MVVWNKKRATGIGPSGRLDLRYCAENKPNGFKEEKAEFYRSCVLGTVAAVWLCLLLGETFFPSFSDGAEKEYSAWQCTSFSLPENWKKMSLMEKGNYCSVRYIKHKQQKQKRMSEIMNKTD